MKQRKSKSPGVLIDGNPCHRAYQLMEMEKKNADIG
jgi:hypothetical protein